MFIKKKGAVEILKPVESFIKWRRNIRWYILY